jgi:2,3-bisphosphoglycerate-independent phosphoglycerate mutase
MKGGMSNNRPIFMSHKNFNTTLLVILDGWGVSDKKQISPSPIRADTAPHFFSWLKKFPYTELEASGEAVGLFKGQEGNSEAGHLNIGAGRIVKQDALYISDAIEDGSFFKNAAFQQALHHVKKYQTAVHVMGLLSNHNSAHSCPEHLYALLELFHQEKIPQVYLHLFTDGRDSGTMDAPLHLKKLREHFYGTEKVASIMGRFYPMDRNRNWDRIEKAYNTIVSGVALYSATSPEEALMQAYERGETDEFISPTVIVEYGKPTATVGDNDALFFFNLRSDRARQLTKALVQKDFEEMHTGVFVRERIPQNTRFVAMTDFGPELPGVLIAFPSRDVKNGLVATLCPRKQLYIAETEKFAHITYFLNGGFAQHFCDEQFVKVESDPLINPHRARLAFFSYPKIRPRPA